MSRISTETDTFETSSLHAAIFAAGDRIAHPQQPRSKSPPPPLPPLPSNSTGRSITSPPSTANTITTAPSSIFSLPVTSTSDLTPIIPNLYISSLSGASNALELSRHGITHILSLTTSKPFLTPPADRQNLIHHHIPLLDDPSAPLLERLPEITKWIFTALEENEEAIVLVHCEYGVSRAPSAVIGYLMATQDVRFGDALRMVKEKRRTASPNTGFVRALSGWGRTKGEWWVDGRPKGKVGVKEQRGMLDPLDGPAAMLEPGVGGDGESQSEGSTLEGTGNQGRLQRLGDELGLKVKGVEAERCGKKRGWLRKLKCW